MPESITQPASAYSRLLRYLGWLALWLPLVLLVSLPIVWVFDVYFPGSMIYFGEPGSLQRLVVIFLWFGAATLLIRPVWQWAGDLFLPREGFAQRFRSFWMVNKEVTRKLEAEFQSKRSR